MHITREADYAIRCMLHLSAREGEVSSVGDIARAQDMSRPFAAKILQKLVKAKLVKSVRGLKGGFTLGRPAAKISLLDAVEAVQGPLALNTCVIDKRSCSRSQKCTVHPVWIKLQADLEKKMRTYNFKKLSETTAPR